MPAICTAEEGPFERVSTMTLSCRSLCLTSLCRLMYSSLTLIRLVSPVVVVFYIIPLTSRPFIDHGSIAFTEMCSMNHITYLWYRIRKYLHCHPCRNAALTSLHRYYTDVEWPYICPQWFVHGDAVDIQVSRILLWLLDRVLTETWRVRPTPNKSKCAQSYTDPVRNPGCPHVLEHWHT